MPPLPITVKEILKNHYTNVCSLNTFITETSPGSIIIKNENKSLQELMNSVYIAVPEKTKPLQNADKRVKKSLPKIVEEVSSKKQYNKSDDLLILTLDGSANFQNQQFFKTAEWEQVHKKVGDRIIQYILQDCSVYQQIGSCVLQVCGKNLEKLFYNKTDNITKQQLVPAAKRKRQQSDDKPRKKLNTGLKWIEENLTKHQAVPPPPKRTRKTRRGKRRGQPAEVVFPGYKYSLQIPINKIMYKQKNYETFPKKHVLNSNSLIALKRSIFETNVMLERWKSQEFGYIPIEEMFYEPGPVDILLKQFQIRHKTFDYRKLLTRNCKIPFSKLRKTQQNMNMNCYVVWSQVLNFLRIILYRVIPKDLLGSGHNQLVMYKNLKEIVLAGKKKEVCLGKMMFKFRIKDCGWANKANGITLREQLVAQMVKWMVTEYFMVIIKSFFYVTDKSDCLGQLFFYRQCRWRNLCRKQLEDLSRRNILQVVSEELNRQMKPLHFGNLRVRFIPKETSMRPIVSLMVKNRKDELRCVLAVLTLVVEKNPSLLGCGKMSVSAVTRKWQDYARRMKATGRGGDLKFIKIDIKDCYNSILQRKLIKVLWQTLSKLNHQNENVLVNIRKVTSLQCRRGVLRAYSRYIVHERGDSINEMIINRKFSTDGIVIGDKLEMWISHKELKTLILNYITRSLFKFGNKYYRHCQGIIQGGILSMIFCNLYYGAMENKHLVEYSQSPDDLLIRFADDYLYVTPDRSRAYKFFDRMIHGFENYNFRVNTGKCTVNFHVEDVPGLQILPPDAEICWLGNKISPKSLDVFVDYSKFDDLQIEYAVKRHFLNPGLRLKQKLIKHITSKSLDMHLNENLNSLPAVVRNVYELFLISAFHFVAHVKCFPPGRGPQKCPKYFIGVIQQSIDALLQLKKRRKVTNSLTGNEVRYLGYSAFEIKLKYSFRFRQIVDKIRNRRRRLVVNLRPEIFKNLDVFPKDFANIVT